jgi:hypothetical protein
VADVEASTRDACMHDVRAHVSAYLRHTDSQDLYATHGQYRMAHGIFAIGFEYWATEFSKLIVKKYQQLLMLPTST